jgi:hypothetical protein
MNLHRRRHEPTSVESAPRPACVALAERGLETSSPPWRGRLWPRRLGMRSGWRPIWEANSESPKRPRKPPAARPRRPLRKIPSSTPGRDAGGQEPARERYPPSDAHP